MGLGHLLRMLAALPLIEIGRLLALFRASGAALFRAGYAIDRSAETAIRAWAAMVQAGQKAEAEKWVRRWWSRRPDRVLAAILGLSALEAADLAAARDYLAGGLQLPPGEDELLDVLEWRVQAEQSEDVAEPLLERLERRRDLPPALAQQVLLERMWRAMRGGRFAQADALADRVLAVDAEPNAAMVKWALAEHAGRAAQAARYRAAANSLPDEQQRYLQCLGLWSIGRREQADALIEALRPVRPDLAERIFRFFHPPEARA